MLSIVGFGGTLARRSRSQAVLVIALQVVVGLGDDRA
jgi:hypothetical protein